MDGHCVQSYDGLPLTYYRAGMDGPWLVLLNSPGMSIEFWAPVIEFLRIHYRVLSMDYRGFPDGEELLPPERLTFSRHVTDLHTVLTSAGVTRPHCVCWCAGAILAHGHHLRFPGFWRSLTAVGFSVARHHEDHRSSPFATLMHTIKRSIEENPASVNRMTTMMRYAGTVRRHDCIQSVMSEGTASLALGLADILAEDSMSNLAVSLLDHPARLRNYLNIFDEFICQKACVTEMEVPVRLINGEHDRFIIDSAAQNQARAVALGIDAVVVPSASHFVLVESPERVAQLIREHVEASQESNLLRSPKLT